jgi:hypothetical protein
LRACKLSANELPSRFADTVFWCVQLRKEALDSAVDNLAQMHELAVKQKELLEEEAFVSVGTLMG